MEAGHGMNLGLSGRAAIVCGSSAGLGLACAEALLAEGVSVVINGRDADRLTVTAARLEKCWPEQVTAIVGDVTSPGGRAALIASCPEADILVTNNSGPEPGAFESYDESAWADALSANLIAPLMLIRDLVSGMRTRKFGRLVCITSAMVTTPRPGMALSSGPRAGLIAALKGLAFEVAKDNVTINMLAPERFDTDRQVRMAEMSVARDKITLADARARQTATIPAARLGRPEEFGATCAFICSEQAGYMTGMNVRLDGGSYPALF
jgi:3-oxoacyl-[acyl-carrier protein] reductase